MKRFFGANFTSTLSIALVLFVLGLMTVGALTAASLAQVLREQFTVTIVVSDVASSDYGERLVKRLEKSRYTASATYISRESALEILQKEVGDNPEDFLGYNPLPPTVELKLKSEYADNDSIKAIVAELKQSQKGNIANFEYEDTLLDTVNDNLQRLAIALSALAIVLLIICISLINNTVRLILHADRFLINTMRLVGATKWFIRRPFIKTHIICGIIAAVVALLALASVVYFFYTRGFATTVTNVLLQPLPLLIIVGTVFLLGILIPALAAWHAADKYMGKSVDELYLM